jgi:hypothetical protein
MNLSKIKLLLNILAGLAVPLVFVYWLSSDGVLKRIIHEYKLLTKELLIAQGQIISAVEFDHEIETGNKVKSVDGYSFEYTYTVIDSVFVIRGSTYFYLPDDKSPNDIPYNVQIEYVIDSPHISRIKDYDDNYSSLWEWFRLAVLGKLLGLIGTIVAAYYIIENGMSIYQERRVH